MEYGFGPCLLKMQKETYVTMWKENYQNTRIVNEQMLP